ncbi:MAG: DUF1801 domain-containing protein [Gemmatimonadota bacterium]
MASTTPATVTEYLDALPAERRAVVSKVRQFVRKHIPRGYQESITHGMIGYSIPLTVFANTYNGLPLGYVALGAKKNYYTLHLMSAYTDPAQQKTLQDGYKRAGKKLDMGKGCLRFTSFDDLELDTIGKVIASTPPSRMITWHEAVHEGKKGSRARRGK